MQSWRANREHRGNIQPNAEQPRSSTRRPTFCPADCLQLGAAGGPSPDFFTTEVPEPTDPFWAVSAISVEPLQPIAAQVVAATGAAENAQSSVAGC